MAERNPLLVAGAALVGALALIALAAPVLAPYPPDEQLDPSGGRHRPPGARLQAVALRDGRWLLAERARRVAEGLEVERLGRTALLPAEEVRNLTATGVADRRVFLLGSDRFGRDLLSRLLYGARVSLLLGGAALLVAVALGLAVGGIAGLGPRWLDGLLMRGVDATLAFPTLLLVLCLAALFGPSFWTLLLVLGGTAWMGVARLLRGELLTLRERDFTLAARASGVPELRIFWRHLLPNALPPVLADASLRIGDLMLVEAALSFLGLGVQPPQASWGNMVADGRDALASAWWVATLPGLAIALAVLGFNLLGDGLRDALDPRRRTDWRTRV